MECKTKEAYSCLPSKDSLNYSSSLFKKIVSVIVITFRVKCFLFVCMYILKHKANKRFENVHADLSWHIIKVISP